MGNSNASGGSPKSNTSKKEEKGGLTRKSTYRSYLGHEEISSGALESPDDTLNGPEDNKRTSIERAVDVPPFLALPDLSGASCIIAGSFDNTGETSQASLRLQDITGGSGYSGSNASDYCVISQKAVSRKDSVKSNKSNRSTRSTNSEMETSGSSLERKSVKLANQFKRIFSVRSKKKLKSSKKSAEEDARRSQSLCASVTIDSLRKFNSLRLSTDQVKERRFQRRRDSLPDTRDLQDFTGLFEEDSFWWENAGTDLDENNNVKKEQLEVEQAEVPQPKEILVPPLPAPFTSTTEILGWTSWRENNAVALIDGVTGQQLTYRDLEELTRRVATGLAKAGVEPGGSVYVVARNCPEVIIVFLATLSLGGVTIMADPKVAHATVTSQLIAFEPTVVVTDSDHVDAAMRIAMFNSKLKVYAVGASKKCPSFKRLLEENPANSDEEPYKSRPDDVSLHVTCWDVLRNTKRYSTRLTNRNVVNSIAQLRSLGQLVWRAAKAPTGMTSAHGCCGKCGADFDRQGPPGSMRLEPEEESKSDVILSVVPFCHPFGLISVALWSLIQQSTLVTVPHWEMRFIQCVCAKYNVTVLPVLSNWTSCITSHPVVKKAGRLPQEVVVVANTIYPNWRTSERLWRAKVKKLTFVYTLAECSGVISAVTVYPNTTGERRAGLIPSGSVVKIVDNEGNILDPELKGEILIKGPQVMESAHNQAAEKIGLLDRGWLRTGDFGMLTKEGHLMMLGHVNDVIRYQGITVSLRAIEDIIGRHLAVGEACVVAGWTLGAHVIKRPGFDDVGPKDILEYANDFMPANCQLQYVEFVESLPLTALGRIVRRLVRPMGRPSIRPHTTPESRYSQSEKEGLL